MLNDAHIIYSRHRFLLAAAYSLAVLGAVLLFAQNVAAQDVVDPGVEARTPLTPAELEELVGPIALYPDDLVSIVLPASTYPLQIVQAARYLHAHETDPALKPNENWDDSVVALLNYPEVIERMNADLEWTQALGEAAVYQQTALLDAIQDFRDRAYAAGNLKSDERQVVRKEVETIVIEPGDPKVIYVPYYEPEYVVVRHVYPVYHFYPRAYPVYYYPYPYGYSFGHSLFWGVTLAFAIDWHSHHVHVRHHQHRAHPYYGRYYHHPYYRRHSVHVSYRDHVWRPRHHDQFRHKHAHARVKAHQRLDENIAGKTTHRSHNGQRFRDSAPHSAKRANGSNRIAHGRDKLAFNSREHARPRQHSTERLGNVTKRSETIVGTREAGPRNERRRTQPSSAHNRPQYSTRGDRSQRSSGSRPKSSNAPRYSSERNVLPQRSAPRRRDSISNESRGKRSFGGIASHSRPALRPGSSGRFRSGTHSGARSHSGFKGHSSFSARSGAGGRSGFGSRSRRHLR